MYFTWCVVWRRLVVHQACLLPLHCAWVSVGADGENVMTGTIFCLGRAQRNSKALGDRGGFLEAMASR